MVVIEAIVAGNVGRTFAYMDAEACDAETVVQVCANTVASKSGAVNALAANTGGAKIGAESARKAGS